LNYQNLLYIKNEEVITNPLSQSQLNHSTTRIINRKQNQPSTLNNFTNLNQPENLTQHQPSNPTCLNHLVFAAQMSSLIPASQFSNSDATALMSANLPAPPSH
jgi:hypothetical protein